MNVSESVGSENFYDAVLVGAGIMSATLAVLLNELDPDIKLLIVERLSSPGLESSSAANNAGTGHAANCELNYTPMKPDGNVDISKALEINKSFENSLELWASLAEQGKIEPSRFLNCVPHISFVWGESDVKFLWQRFSQLSNHNGFSNMEWSTDRQELTNWMPMVMNGRNPEQIVAATRINRGTDIDFGSLTNAYLENLNRTGCLDLVLSTEVVNLNQDVNKEWNIFLQGEKDSKIVKTPFVFLGAGGGALSLLQKSSIPEALGYGGFPVSGQWLVCSDVQLAQNHHAKVYGKAKVGSPPMSVPHLDSRWISGQRSLLFGPFAGFSTKFLKSGSFSDLFRSVKTTNLAPMLQVGFKNFDLIKYLFNQLRQDDLDRFASLKEFLPMASLRDWTLSIAGQRVQIIKNSSQGGVLQMGTEVVTSSDGTLAALLGASPGASTAVTIMLEVLRRCWSDKMSSEDWKTRLKNLLPSFAKELSNEDDLLLKMRERSDTILKLSQ